jgi:hypothetical protein
MDDGGLQFETLAQLVGEELPARPRFSKLGLARRRWLAASALVLLWGLAVAIAGRVGGGRPVARREVGPAARTSPAPPQRLGGTAAAPRFPQPARLPTQQRHRPPSPPVPRPASGSGEGEREPTAVTADRQQEEPVAQRPVPVGPAPASASPKPHRQARGPAIAEFGFEGGGSGRNG